MVAMWSLLEFLLFGIVLQYSLGQTRRPIRCYECSTLFDPNCAAPFDNRTFPMTFCPPDSTMCSVITQQEKSGGSPSKLTIRMCATNGTILLKNHCLMGAAESDNMRICHCNHSDGCNQDTVETDMKKEFDAVYITELTVSNQTLHLRWSVNNETAEMPISKYRIDYRYRATDPKAKKRWVNNKHITSKKSDTTIRNLIPGMRYKVRVTVKTRSGNGIFPRSKWYEIDSDKQDEVNATDHHQSIPIRLPETIRPEHYNLTFYPQIYGTKEEDFVNQGTAVITVLCTQKTDKIMLHSKSLNWTKVELTDQKQNNLTVTLKHFTKEEMVEVKADKPLKVNQKYHLYIEYVGKITDFLKGFYYSPYKEDNTTKYIFTTMMQPTDARLVFPCFDQPDFKATFQINIIREKSVRSLSNAVLDHTETLGNGLLVDRYADSLKMSTYLVAFAIGDLDYLETAARDIQFRTWSRKGAVNMTEFALDIGAKLITFFEDYFQIKYPMVKEDMLAVPTLIFNAMEHWGMITYREAGMLYEAGVSSEADKEWTAIIIAHELSHQWFGNLVSPKWWDDLWLNEGFATYMMFLAVDAVLPEWKMLNKLPVNYRGVQNVMSIDDLLTSHPVYIPVTHPDEINEIFDLISYAKGCAVIRMMNFFLGDKTFTNGLTSYLNEYSYSTATHSDLWQVLGKTSADDGNEITDVKSVMDTWLLEMNYPVVTVIRTSPTTFTLSQAAFLLDESQRRNRSNVFWEIPFAYTHEVEPNFDKRPEDIIWLHKNGDEVQVEDKSLAKSSWIIGNVQQYGFFRVQYDLENWNAILEQLKTNHLIIHPINRAQIINDAWNLARAELLDFDIALKTLEYLDQEVDYVPWKAAFRELDYLRKSLQLTPAYGDFMLFMRKKLKNAYLKSIRADTHYEKIQSSVVAEQACKYGMKSCVNKATKQFQRWISDSSIRVNPDQKFSIYCTGVKLGGAPVWDEVFKRYSETTSSSERLYLLEAMSCVDQPWLIKRFLELTISSNVFSNTDKVDAMSYIADNPIGRLMAWDFVLENWDFYFDRYGSGLNLFAKLIKSLTTSYNTVTELNKVETFVQEHEDLGTAKREFNNALVKIKLNLAWMENHYDGLQKWLKEQTVVI